MSTKASSGRLLFLLCLLLASASAFQPISPQTASTGALIGTVSEASGAVIPGARVIVRDPRTGARRTVLSSAEGTFEVTQLSPGVYEVAVEAPAFATQTIPGVGVDVTETHRVDIRLVVKGASQNVVVEAEAALLQTQSVTLGRVANQNMVDGLPLVTRNYTQILGLYPGVQADVNNAGALGRNSPDVWVNGGRAIDNDYQMDGTHIDNFGSAKAGDWLGYTGIAIPNPDSIQEFKVQTNLYDASYGRGSGANVNVVTKAGSNELHGNLFEYFRNDVLNANDFFLKQNGQPRPVLKQNQFGGTLGGPLLKDRIFFFGSYQGTRQSDGLGSQSLQSAFLPPLTNDRSVANLGALFCGQQGAQGGVRVACDGRNINPVAYALLNAKLPNGAYVIPTPQRIESGGLGFSVFSKVSRFAEDQIVYSMDLLHGTKNTLSGRFFWLVCTDSTRANDVELLGEFTQLLAHVPRSLLVGSFGPPERFTCQELRHASPLGFMLASFLTSIEAVLDDVTDQAAENLSKIATSLIIATLADMTAAKLDHASWTKQATLFRAQSFIQQNFKNPDLTPTKVAIGLRLSVRYLQTLFRDMGKTPSDYLWGCRLEGGKRDLEDPALRGLSIGEIAWRNGFADLSHFSSRFRQAYGESPRAVRMQASAEAPYSTAGITGTNTIRLYSSR